MKGNTMSKNSDWIRKSLMGSTTLPMGTLPRSGPVSGHTHNHKADGSCCGHDHGHNYDDVHDHDGHVHDENCTH